MPAIETSGMSFEAPDTKKDTMDESKAQRLAEFLAAAGSEEDRDAEREGGDAQRNRAYAFLLRRYAQDNGIGIQRSSVSISEQAAVGGGGAVEEVG